MKTKVNADGFINHGLGDWCNPRNKLARENIETAFLYADAAVLAQFAEILDNDEDKAALEAYGSEDTGGDIVKAFRCTLERDGAFICGEVGLPYVIQTARRYGLNGLIAGFITRPEHPSCYAFVLDGETTLGKYWEQNPAATAMT